jgi:hypothetical protein
MIKRNSTQIIFFIFEKKNINIYIYIIEDYSNIIYIIFIYFFIIEISSNNIEIIII